MFWSFVRHLCVPFFLITLVIVLKSCGRCPAENRTFVRLRRNLGCIDSILNQSFTDYELLLIDDGSPDRCPQICDEYAQQNDHVRVFHKPNGGLSDARNYGLDQMKGDYVSFIDSDDYVGPDYLKTLMDL